MSKFTGGIFSKSRGKLSGIVFSAARAREGKVMTAREFVIPANPQTTPQQSNRMLFDYIQKLVRAFGPAIYRPIFNRGVQDLPGYQTLLSLFRRAYTEFSATVWQASSQNPDTLLGQLHFPDSVTVQPLSGNDLQVDWSTELGDNGQDADQVYILAADYRVDTGDDETWGVAQGIADRSDGTLTVTRSDPGGGGSWGLGANFVVVLYNPLNEEQVQRSIARWYTELE